MSSRLPQSILLRQSSRNLKDFWQRAKVYPTVRQHHKWNSVQECKAYDYTRVLSLVKKNGSGWNYKVKCLVCGRTGIVHNFDKKDVGEIIEPRIYYRKSHAWGIISLIFFIVFFSVVMTYIITFADNKFENRIKQAEATRSYTAGEAAMCNAANEHANQEPRTWVDCTIQSNDGRGRYTVKYKHPDGGTERVINNHRILDIKEKGATSAP